MPNLSISHKKNLIAVSTALPHKQEEAKAWALALHLPFVSDPEEMNQYDYLLLLTSDLIGLKKKNDKIIFAIDFLSGKMRYRTQHAGLQKELLAKSLGVKPKDHPLIIDATAGWGRDSFMLAALGFQVTMLERSPLLCVLLEDAFRRATVDPNIAPVIQRLQLITTDAIIWLKKMPLAPDIIYLDPLFPERKKSASIKKEMAILRDLLENDLDSDELFQTALACANYRVVVKRPRLAPNLAGMKPDFSTVGRSSRFDIYLKNR